ncbi:MAG: hypothetical protein ACI95C_000851 [Pseudohongiellaceae bacterium]|jgi:hypothetical protein
MKFSSSVKYSRHVIALSFLGLSSLTLGNEFYSLSLSVGDEANVSRGLDDFHRIDSVFNQVELTAGKLFQLGLNDTLSVSATARQTLYNELPGFDRLELGIGASYRHRFGFGPMAPSLNIASSYAQARSDGAARDADSGSIELSLSKQFKSGIALSAGIDYQRSRTDLLPIDPSVAAFGYDPLSRPPFEILAFESASLFIGADYTFYNGWMLSAGYRRINGATVASTTTPRLQVYKISNAFYSDPGFHDDELLNWFAYQLETNTDQYSTAISIPVLQDTSIDIGASWNDITAPLGLDYDNSIFTISLIHNF